MKKLNNITPIPLLHQIIWWVVRAMLLIFAVHGLFTNSVTEFLMGMFSIAFSHLWDMFQLFGGKSFITRVSYSGQTLLISSSSSAALWGLILTLRPAFSMPT